MPIFKTCEGKYLDIPYYKFVFKNDLIKQGERVFPVKYANVGMEQMFVTKFVERGYDDSVIGDYYLLKRPFKNWCKYFLCLLIGKYIK